MPSDVRDSACSWLVISMSGQLIIPAWYAPVGLSVPLALASPLAYLAGALLQPVTDTSTLIVAAMLLLAVGLVHGGGRYVLYGSAAAADADLDRADRAAREQYSVLRGNIERREHERPLHDTVLNTLTALARTGGLAARETAAAVAIAVGAVAAIGAVHRVPGDSGSADLAILGTAGLLVLVVLSHSARVSIPVALLVFAVQGTLLIREQGLNLLSLSQLGAAGYIRERDRGGRGIP